NVEPVGVLDLGANVLELGVVAWLVRWLRPARAAGLSSSAPPKLVLRLSLGALLALVACTVAPPPPALTPAPSPSPIPSGHEADGLALGGQTDKETVYAAARCPPAAPLREYAIVAMNVEITLNRYLDYEPEGRVYVLEEN